MIRERRKYQRYDTDIKIYFRVNYDIKTKVRFRVAKKGRLLSRKYPAISRNVSAEGLGFSSNKKLKKGNYLYLEVYLPRKKEPIFMEGKVRWSEPIAPEQKSRYRFNTGVKLTTVLNTPVAESIYYDKKSHIVWSAVLDSVFGNFRRLMQKYKAKIGNF